jgi:MSHA biogenesis protein MshO
MIMNKKRQMVTAKADGFTLVELVLTIVILSIVASFASNIVGRQMEIYQDAVSRATLVDQAEMALRRMQRDIRAALPNSVRVDGAGTVTVIEMVNVLAGLPYRVGAPAGGANAASQLNFSVADDSFRVFGQLDGAIDLTNARLVINNQSTVTAAGAPMKGVNIYATAAADGPFPLAGSHVATPAATTITRTSPAAPPAPQEDLLTLDALDPDDAPHLFALRSPEQRLYIVDRPFSFHCDIATGTLSFIWGYDRSENQPVELADFVNRNEAALATNLSDCTIRSVAGVFERSGVISMALTVTDPDNGESVNLMHQVHVDNLP